MPTPHSAAVLGWYDEHAARPPVAPGLTRTSWAVLVSEVMLQQTPVTRVLPVYAGWLGRGRRRPTGGRAAARRAVGAARLPTAGAPAARDRTGAGGAARRGGPPVDALWELPGIGAYTAAAVASFAFGQRHAVLDTNVRRVLARLVSGRRLPPPSTSARTAAGRVVLPDRPRCRTLVGRGDGTRRAGLHRAGRSARLPGGRPTAPGAGPGAPQVAVPGAARRTRAPTGSAAASCWPCSGRRPGRCRVRSSTRPGPEPQQRSRALDSLVADGLVDPLPDGRFALPSTAPAVRPEATAGKHARRGPSPPAERRTVVRRREALSGGP